MLKPLYSAASDWSHTFYSQADFVWAIDTIFNSNDSCMLITVISLVYYCIDIPDVIPADDITQLERTITTVIVQWKEPNYYNAPITKYTLNLCQKAEQDSCTTVNGYPVDINPPERIINGSTVLLRYGLLLQ